MLTIRFVRWFNSLPVLGLRDGPSDYPFPNRGGTLISATQADEANLMYAWAALTVAGAFVMGACSAAGYYSFRSVGSWLGLGIGLLLPIFTVTGLILQGIRSTLLSAYVGRAKIRVWTGRAKRWEDDVEEHEPHGFFRWLVTWRDADFALQAAVAVIALVLQLLAGP